MLVEARDPNALARPSAHAYLADSTSGEGTARAMLRALAAALGAAVVAAYLRSRVLRSRRALAAAPGKVKVACPCGALSFTASEAPMMRTVCHCTFCQGFAKGEGFSDVCMLKAASCTPVVGDVEIKVAKTFKRSHCAKCGNYVFTELNIPGIGPPRFTRTRLIEAPSLVPKVAMHTHYNMRVSDKFDNDGAEKIEGDVSSALLALGPMLKGFYFPASAEEEEKACEPNPYIHIAETVFCAMRRCPDGRNGFVGKKKSSYLKDDDHKEQKEFRFGAPPYQAEKQKRVR